MAIAAPTRQRPRIFYGWWMVALAGFVHSINSSAYNKGYVIFLLPVAQGLGVSLASISVVFSLARSEGGPVSPVGGWLIDRFGPKPVLFVGTVMSGVGFLLLSRTQNIWTFGLVYLALITLGSDLAFSNALSALVNNWFQRQRAMAMASYFAISSLAPAFLVPLLFLLISTEGWRTASTVAGFVILAVPLPLALLVRNTPESAGMLPDGGPRGQAFRAAAETTAQHPLTTESTYADFNLKAALHSVSYWMLLTGSFLRLTSKSGVMFHIIPIMVWKGLEQQTAANIFGLLLFVTVPLSLVTGWLGDKLPKNPILFVTAVSGTTAFLLLASPLSSIWTVYLFVFLFALAETSGSLNWATFGDYFGRKAYGRLRGITQLMASPGVFLAPIFSGWWYDRVESYTLPLWVFTIFFGLGALTFALLRKPQGGQQPEASSGPRELVAKA